MKRRDLIKHLNANCCVLFREGANHSIFINTITQKLTAIPRHAEINDYTIKEICKQLGIPKAGKN
ncbi:MAG: type II toxin-antitoxin system HicA family toxin [Bacteroidales bacterium]|nr:type II toxin-antitoxin system HicA family toxin [Bacteroidales bacterium]